MKKILIIIGIMCCLTGCTKEQKEEDKLYLSIKNRISNTINDETGEADTVFYTVDLKNGIEKEQETLHYYYNYSGGLYDKAEKKYYYIDRDFCGESYCGDNVYIYDENNQQKEKANNDLMLGTNNYVYKNGNRLYLVSAQVDEYYQPHALYELDLETNEIELLYGDEDLTITQADYNPITDEVIFSLQSWSKRYASIVEAVGEKGEGGTGIQIQPTNYIYTYKDGKASEIVEAGPGEILDLAVNDSYVVYHYNYSKLYNYENRNEVVFDDYVTIDRESGESSTGVLGKTIDNLYEIYYISEDNQYMICDIYYDTGREVYDKIVKYDFETEEITELFDLQNTLSFGTVHVVVMKDE